MIEAPENMGNDSDDEYSEPAVRPLSRRRVALFRDQFNLEGLPSSIGGLLLTLSRRTRALIISKSLISQLHFETSLIQQPSKRLVAYSKSVGARFTKHLEECKWTGQREGRRQIIPPKKPGKLEEYLLDRFGSDNPATYIDTWD
jgi:hypothetical protein